MALTGEPITGERARKWGLIWNVFPDNKLMSASEAMALKLANVQSFGVTTFIKSMQLSEHNSLPVQLDVEAELQACCYASEQAILLKRWGRKVEIANAALYLSSAMAYINGAILDVDGGYQLGDASTDCLTPIQH